MWRVLLKRKNALDWNTCLISMFSEIFEIFRNFCYLQQCLSIDLLSYYEWSFASRVHKKSFKTWFSRMFLIKAWLNVKVLFTVLWNTRKAMGNNQKATHPALLSNPLIHGYHTLQLTNAAIPAMAFSPHNFKTSPTFHMEIFWIGNPTYFFSGDR